MINQTSPEHIAHALWQMRAKFRALHALDFESEWTLYAAVKHDLSKQFYRTIDTAISFYRDLNTATLQETRK